MRADDVRDAALLDGTVTPARLRDALLEALDSVNGELSNYRATQEARGYAKLADVPADRLDDD
ncbi:head completion/stabilization protein, partial [Corallococcus coralloides]|nr:head completion/stabilization protein [Corallococcus coralloides]